MITIAIPVGGGTPALVKGGSPGQICATGTASRAKEVLVKVRAKVYPAPMLPDANPPADAGTATLPGGGAWQFNGANLLVGARCTAASPFSSNTLRVWAFYDGDPAPDRTDTTFGGKCSTKTDCD
jgi:hypothetical protein